MPVQHRERAPHLPGSEPFSADGGPVGVVFCHGFTGSPQSVRPWAEAVAAAGHTVRLPRLPGHGTRWQDLQLSRWPDWYATVERAHDELRERCDRVVVAGLSMGGALALRLAEQRPDVDAVVLVNPFVTRGTRAMRLVPLVQLVLPTTAGIASDVAREGAAEVGYDRVPLRALASLLDLTRTVRADLDAVRAPVLLFRSAVDHVVAPDGAELLRARLGGGRVTEVVLERSFHVATLDHDAPVVEARTLELLAGLRAGPAAPVARPGGPSAGSPAGSTAGGVR